MVAVPMAEERGTTPSGAEETGARLRLAVKAHYASVWRAVRRLGVSDADADDVLQEVFLAFSRKVAEVDPRAEKSFLLQAAVRVVLQRRRSLARRREDVKGDVDDVLDPAPSPEEASSRKEALETLDRLLAEMPMELRAVLTLCELEQVTMRDAAAILDIAPGTVASRLSRARELFDQLARRGGGSNPGGRVSTSNGRTANTGGKR